jgi:HEAT repeat protein
MNEKDLQAEVLYYVARLNRDSSAWHSLVELGFEALPKIREAFRSSADGRKRALLIEVLAERRDEESFPLFNEALYSPVSEVWKTALDALVTLGGPTAKALLEIAEAELPIKRRAWIREALKQIS